MKKLFCSRTYENSVVRFRRQKENYISRIFLALVVVIVYLKIVIDTERIGRQEVEKLRLFGFHRWNFDFNY